MVKEIEIFEKKLHFRNSFEIAYEKVNYAKIIIIKIIDKQGRYGLGSAAPAKEYSGENIAGTLKIISKFLKPDFFNLPLGEWSLYHEKIQKVFKGYPSAQSAVEEAVLNLFCQQKGITLADIFGHGRKKAKLMVTVGIQDLKPTLKEVKKRLQEGFSVIKLKCGLNLSKDLKRIKAVINILPKQAKLTLDANQGYSFSEAKQLLTIFKKSPPEAPRPPSQAKRSGGDAPLAQKISLIEQPIAARNLTGLKKLGALKSIPVIADEAVVTVKDAFKIMKGNYADGVNVKLMKCGGLINLLKVCDQARKLKKIAMIGCVYESNISITTGAYLALARPIDYVDLDSGHFDFPDDPVKGGAKVVAGKIMIEKNLSLI